MIATAVLAADYAGTLDLADTSTVRARATQQISPGGPTQAVQGAVDVATTPSASAYLTNRHWAYTLTYAATLTAPDLEEGFQARGFQAPQLFQFASAIAAWHDRSTTFNVTQTGSFGQLSSAYLYQSPVTPGQTPVLQTAPATTTIYLGGSTTDATIGQRVGHDVLLAISGGYVVSGGLDNTSRTVLPLQYGPRASASLAYQPSLRDTITTRALAQEISTTGECAPPINVGICHERVDGIQADETFRRRLSRTILFSLGGGFALYDADALGVDTTTIYPVVLTSLSYHFGFKGVSEFELSAQLAPTIDLRTGLPSERAQGNANFIDRIIPSLTLHVGIGVIQSVLSDDPYFVSSVSGSIDAIYRLGRQADLSFGQQWLWQEQTGYGTLVSAFTFVALTVRTLPTRL
jgi:hypothetical protein